MTPSHQYPLGVAMTASRRLKALAWARRAGAWLVEDDYDSEFRYEGQPLPSLQGLDDDARVIYVGTFSKILFPAVRIGYLVAPRDLVPPLRRVRQAMDIFPAPLLQSVLAEFVADGHFARHLRRMRAVYAERRSALSEAIAKELPDTLRVVGDRAGMHLAALLPAGVDDHAVSARAARRGISAAPLSECYFGPRKRAGLVLGYGGTKPHAMREAVRTLKAAIEG
jgi:GntR family transcriptional regulator/MocR family aminotransferase